MLKRRGARTNPCGTPFLKRRNVLLLPFPVVRVKLRLLPSPWIIWTMCLSCSNRRSLQVRPRGHTLSSAAVRSTNTAPALILPEKLSSMSCVNKGTWSTADLPRGKPTYSRGSNGSMIGSTRA